MDENLSAYKVIKYTHVYYDAWNRFVENSKNGSFLFHRDFMEYHKERFEDYSLMVFKKETLMAILPANISGNCVFSHQGLTYGGIVLSKTTAFQSTLGTLYAILEFLFENDIENLYLKEIPDIYHLKPSGELPYLLHILKAETYRNDVSMAIKLDAPFKFSTLRKRQLKKANKNDLVVKKETNFSTFWNTILIPNLKTKHQTKPTHALAEITLLHAKFPNNIKQYNVYDCDELLAGCTVFETESVVHLQYISTEKVKNVGALDFLVNFLITDVYKDKRYFDFGISNENEGKNINEGLLNWKQSFGASAVIHRFYNIEVQNYSALKNIMI